jgi:hypothetical protein
MSIQEDSVDNVLANLAAGRFRSARAATFGNTAPLSTIYTRLHGRPKRVNIDLNS